MRAMRTVKVSAVNIKVGDVLNGQRVCHVVKHIKRNNTIGMVVLAPNTKGYDIDVFKFASTAKVNIKRPGYNMYRRAKNYKEQRV